ncbi:MAG: hypothetical protein ACLQDQ_15460 [Myxococcaceae bacterium]
MSAPAPSIRRPLLAVSGLLGVALALACSPGPPVLCAVGLPDGGCSYHVEVHCGDLAVCSQGSQVLDAGSCVRDTAADIIMGCT